MLYFRRWVVLGKFLSAQKLALASSCLCFPRLPSLPGLTFWRLKGRFIMAWRIPDWKKFEPPIRSDRDSTKELRWWKCPVTQNRRYKLLVRTRNGWKLLGVWHALVASWGRQTAKSRQGGVFRTALAGNKPATLEELSADTLVPKNTLDTAIKRLIELGWLTAVSNHDIPLDIPPDVPAVRQLESETRLD